MADVKNGTMKEEGPILFLVLTISRRKSPFLLNCLQLLLSVKYLLNTFTQIANAIVLDRQSCC